LQGERFGGTRHPPGGTKLILRAKFKVRGKELWFQPWGLHCWAEKRAGKNPEKKTVPAEKG